MNKFERFLQYWPPDVISRGTFRVWSRVQGDWGKGVLCTVKPNASMEMVTWDYPTVLTSGSNVSWVMVTWDPHEKTD